MRIIEHGDQYEIGEKTCVKCGCKFAYTKKDITVERISEYDEGTYGRDFYDAKVVHCPECKYLIQL